MDVVRDVYGEDMQRFASAATKAIGDAAAFGPLPSWNDRNTPGTAVEQPTAGDLYLQACESWIAHMDEPHAPTDEDCPTCELHMNRVRLARAVWQKSQHQAVSR